MVNAVLPLWKRKRLYWGGGVERETERQRERQRERENICVQPGRKEGLVSDSAPNTPQRALSDCIATTTVAPHIELRLRVGYSRKMARIRDKSVCEAFLANYYIKI